jgi:hypothetical protein
VKKMAAINEDLLSTLDKAQEVVANEHEAAALERMRAELRTASSPAVANIDLLGALVYLRDNTATNTQETDLLQKAIVTLMTQGSAEGIDTTKVKNCAIELATRLADRDIKSAAKAFLEFVRGTGTVLGLGQNDYEELAGILKSLDEEAP